MLNILEPGPSLHFDLFLSRGQWSSFSTFPLQPPICPFFNCFRARMHSQPSMSVAGQVAIVFSPSSVQQGLHSRSVQLWISWVSSLAGFQNSSWLKNIGHISYACICAMVFIPEIEDRVTSPCFAHHLDVACAAILESHTRAEEEKKKKCKVNHLCKIKKNINDREESLDFFLAGWQFHFTILFSRNIYISHIVHPGFFQNCCCLWSCICTYALISCHCSKRHTCSNHFWYDQL